MNIKKSCHLHPEDGGSLISEVLCHLPYAIFSVASGLIILSFLGFITPIIDTGAAHTLFHSFHFLHIVFAATGAVITFSRFSDNRLMGVIVAMISSIVFCTLSDIIMPYFSGMLLGVSMHFHLCIVSELHNLIPFLLVGLLNGFIMGQRSAAVKGFYSVSSHFVHILVSSLASLLYMASEGFANWQSQMGMVFILLIFAVVIPCTLSDIIIPAVCANLDRKK